MKKLSKIIGLTFIFIFFSSFLLNFAQAAVPTIKIERWSNQQNGQTGKWSWVFQITTTDISNNTNILINIYKDGVLDTAQVKEILSGNKASYYTGSVLDTGSNYKITFRVENSSLGADYFAKAGSSDPEEIIYIKPQGVSAWTYTQGPIPNTPQFQTQEACNTHRTSFLSTPGYTATPCESITSYGGPIIDDSDPVIIDPQDGPTEGNGIYKLLAPIGNLVQAPSNVGDYFNIIFKIAIGLCAVLAVIMIVIGGIQYMGNESIFGKTEAKSRITAAILGLLIALGSYALLNTINPDLLGGKGVTIEQVTAEIGGDTDAPIGGANSLPSGIICSGGKANIPNIINSFSGKMTYEMGAKGVPGPNNTIKLDCSGFVNYVLRCASVSFVNGGTASIFNNAEKVNSISGNTRVNGIELKTGDLVGWRQSDTTKYKYGHVMIYIGGGNVQFADSHGGSSVGNALGIFPISKYKDDIKFIRRAP